MSEDKIGNEATCQLELALRRTAMCCMGAGERRKGVVLM